MTTNTALLLNLIDRYNDLAYTHRYIFGFFFHGNVYMAYANASTLPAILCVDKASRGQGMALRFCPNKDIKIALMADAEMICSKKYFEDMLTNSKYNKGEIFEKLVTEYYGQTWEKDTVPFWVQGDICVDGKELQIKLDSATLMNTKQIARLRG